MKISDAKGLVYDNKTIRRAYVGNTLVWTRPDYVVSSGVTGANGFTVGTSVTKNMTSGTKVSPAALIPGTVDYTANRSYWSSWGNDIFNAWGFPYLYDTQQNNFFPLLFTTINQADGVIATETRTFNDRTFTIKHGYPAQGIYKLDVSVNDKDKGFIFGMEGNLGSNGTTRVTDFVVPHTLFGESINIYYSRNFEGNLPDEDFYYYVVPYEISKNQAVRPYSRIYQTDNLGLFSNDVFKGVTVYLSKQNDVIDWIKNDLTINNL
jgi:hypothetical protein